LKQNFNKKLKVMMRLNIFFSFTYFLRIELLFNHQNRSVSLSMLLVLLWDFIHFHIFGVFKDLLNLFLTLLKFFPFICYSLLDYLIYIDIFICPIMNTSDNTESYHVSKNCVKYQTPNRANTGHYWQYCINYSFILDWSTHLSVHFKN